MTLISRREFIRNISFGGVNLYLACGSKLSSHEFGTVSIRGAHELSKSYVIDPAYSSETVCPNSAGLSLFSDKSSGPCWLYNWGDLESYLLQRMRHEAFKTCINVGYPGHFKVFSPVLFIKHSFELCSMPIDGKCKIYYSGIIDCRINGKVVLHEAGTPNPSLREIDVLGHLKIGTNTISVRVHRIEEPPSFLFDSIFLKTDGSWLVGVDRQTWSAPAFYPFEGNGSFPHQERLPFIVVRPVAQQSNVYDFGVELLGLPALTARGEGKIEIYPGESLLEAKDTERMNQEQMQVQIEAKPGRNKSFEERALRYMRLDSSAGVEAEDVEVEASFYPAQYRGAFACSDELLNKIWMHSAYTLRLCMREFFVDGIKRDRLPWGGDLYMGTLCNAFSFAERSIVNRTLTALYSQRPEVSDVNGIIDYTLYWVMTLRDYVCFFGDTNYLYRVRPWFEEIMKALQGKEDKNGVLPSERFSWVFIDWADVKKRGVSSCLQMLYVLALEAASQLSKFVRDDYRSTLFMKKARELRKLCQAMFWDRKRRLFVDNWHNGKQGTHTSRHSNLFAIISCIANEDQIACVLKNVLMNDDFEPVGTPFMKALELKALCQCGQKDRMIESLHHYWGGMLRRGATTFWEAFNISDTETTQYSFYNRPFGKSLCHAWSAGPIFLLSGELMGIKPIDIGWKRFLASAGPVGLDWVCASIPTPYGNIQYDLKGSRLCISLPKGTSLEYRPLKGKTKIYCGPKVVTVDVG